jgi:hypothetical protein
MSDRELTRRRPWLVRFGYRVLLPLIGFFVGITVDRLVLVPRTPNFGPPQIPGTEINPAMREVFVRKLGAELDLSESQRQAVSALIEQQYPRVKAAGDSARAVFERATVEPRTEMMKILTPAQRKRMHELTGMPILTELEEGTHAPTDR